MERSSTVAWPLANTPARSDSDTAAVTTGIVAEWAWMGALRKKGSEVPSQWQPPATDLELGRGRWEAVDCARGVTSEGTMR
jgi:hypothetical protein